MNTLSFRARRAGGGPRRLRHNAAQPQQSPNAVRGSISRSNAADVVALLTNVPRHRGTGGGAPEPRKRTQNLVMRGRQQSPRCRPQAARVVKPGPGKHGGTTSNRPSPGKEKLACMPGSRSWWHEATPPISPPRNLGVYWTGFGAEGFTRLYLRGGVTTMRTGPGTPTASLDSPLLPGKDFRPAGHPPGGVDRAMDAHRRPRTCTVRRNQLPDATCLKDAPTACGGKAGGVLGAGREGGGPSVQGPTCSITRDEMPPRSSERGPQHGGRGFKELNSAYCSVSINAESGAHGLRLSKILRARLPGGDPVRGPDKQGAERLPGPGRRARGRFARADENGRALSRQLVKTMVDVRQTVAAG